MDILKLMFFCVIVLLPLTLLKKYSSEQAVLLSIAAAMLLLFRFITYLAPFLSTVEALFERVGGNGLHITILFKTVAASQVSRICADLCRDGGSQMLATLVESAGTIAVLLISMPLLQAVIDLLLGYFH